MRNRRLPPIFGLILLHSACSGFVASAQAQGGIFQFCGGSPCAGKNPKVKSVTILQQAGARPRWSPDGSRMVFDRPNADGYYDVYLMDPSGNITQSLTDGNSKIGQRNNGNARFDKSGNNIIFVSETANHYGGDAVWMGDPGVGLFSNFWTTNLSGSQFSQLTSIPVKQTALDGIPAMATVNPVFSPDGSQLIWTERYAEGGKWGLWRLRIAPYSAAGGSPRVGSSSVLFTPSQGTYVTAMGFPDPGSLIVAGNPNGQDVYGMDQYNLNLQSGAFANLTNTPGHWEEDSCVSPNGQWVVYMTDQTSNFPLDFTNLDWPSQPRQREYWMMSPNGEFKERLTYFNDPAAPEFVNTGQNRTIVAACDFSPDGRYLAATIGIDYGTSDTASIQLKAARIEFSDPSLFGTPPAASAPVVNGASFQRGFAPNSWVTVRGSNLARSPRTWTSSDFSGNNLPTSLDGVSVTINGKPAYIYYVSPTQLNVLAPDDTVRGDVQVQVTTPAGAVLTATATEQTYAPAFFMFSPQGMRYVAAEHVDGRFIGNTSLYPGSTTPAKPGETIALFANGLGPTNPPQPAGQMVAQPLNLSSPVNIRIGGVPAFVQFAGLVTSGLYQLNVVVPASLPDGDQAVTAEINGAQTQGNAYVSIQH